MSQDLPPNFCPYKGLQPYTEQDCAFFFGRTHDQQIIISNLYAAQLTVFYGASGVGKSSVLLAGTVPLLKQEPNLTAVVFRNWQDPNFASQLKQCTLEAVSSRAGKQIEVDVTLPLDDFLGQVARASRGLLFFVFDQFEEYFLYNPPSPKADTFEAEFARTVNRRGLDANFLLSLREDGLSKLDRFQGRIPMLMNNLLRLEHLDRDGAREAITKPLDEYNRRLGNGPGMVTIEPNLVESVLDDLQAVKVTSEQTGRGAIENPSATSSEVEIETPLLQVVLTRLWDEERAAGSHVLRLQTFNALGRAENIARTHLDTIMGRLTDPERDHASNILRYMVTPSGSKIAQEAAALASWTELTEAQVQTILTRLSGPDMRILRTMQAAGELPRYEIFHDVLARAILNWRARYVQDQNLRLQVERARAEAVEARKQARTRFLRYLAVGLSVLGLVVIVLAHKAVKTAHSRDLARSSTAMLKADPELSLLLAMEAERVQSTSWSRDALEQSLVAYQPSVELRDSENTAAIRSVVIGPDGKYVITCRWESDAPQVWDITTKKIVASLKGHTGYVNSASFSNDGVYVVTASWDKTARVWKGWRTATPQVVATLPEKKPIWTAAFSPDGEYVLTGGEDGKVHVWSWKTNPTSVEELDVAEALARRTPVSTPSPVPSPNASPGATPAPSPTPSKLVFRAAFSSDGQYIIIAAKALTVLIWEWRKKERSESNPLSLLGHKKAVYDAVFSRDGEYAVTGGDDKTARVWEWQRWKQQDQKGEVLLKELPASVRGVAFSPDGTLVATATEQGITELWNWRLWEAQPGSKGEEEHRWPIELRGHKGTVFSVVFSRDGRFVGTGSEDGTARVWQFQTDNKPALHALPVADLLRKAEARVTRQLTDEEKRTYLDY